MTERDVDRIATVVEPLHNGRVRESLDAGQDGKRVLPVHDVWLHIKGVYPFDGFDVL